MNITDNGYSLIDSVKANVPDCFVFRTNKIGSANGEAKFYIGGSRTKDWATFFGNFSMQCFFTKKDLLNYLDMAEFEYKEQLQVYQNDISLYWNSRKEETEKLSDEEFFQIFHKPYKNADRYYIQSHDNIYTFFRKLVLPVITSILIQKIKIKGIIYLWFRPYINEIGNVFENEIINEFVDKTIEKVKQDPTITQTEKTQLTNARIGQGYFRDKIIEKYNGKCIITGVDDERILIASHIKPWYDSNNKERLSKENGLLLTPTYDKLFDKGFISFKDNGEIILSEYFNEQNFKILNLFPKKKYNLKITKEIKIYLQYHRKTILRFL